MLNSMRLQPDIFHEKTSAVDFYLLHGLREERWQALRDLGVRGWAERKIAEGKIRHLGFSFHDSFEVFGIAQAPSDPQIRNLLDPIPSEQLAPPFWRVFEQLRDTIRIPWRRRASTASLRWNLNS